MAEPTRDADDNFSVWLAKYGKGSLDDELTAALSDVAAAVLMLDKAGSVTLTLKMTKRANGIEVSPEVKLKTPESPNNQFYYLNSSGFLTRRDPQQPSIPGTEHLTND